MRYMLSGWERGQQVIAEVDTLFEASLICEIWQEGGLDNVAVYSAKGDEWTLRHPMDGLGVS